MFRHIAKRTVMEQPLSATATGYYRWLQRRVAPRMLVDQTHPNLWHVEQLLQHFPRARFLAISRNPYSVVYSMQRHEGVSRWIQEHDRYPKPNRFLGIARHQIERYTHELSNLQRSVFRWCAHEARIADVAARFPESVLRIRYEDLGRDLDAGMRRIAAFLRVTPPDQMPAFSVDSLHKRDRLSTQERQEIDRALALYRDESAAGTN